MLFFSCNASKLTSENKIQEKSKLKIQAMLEKGAALLHETEGGTFSFDHQKVSAPENWSTKKWNFEYGETFALSVIEAKYFDYAQSLLDLENEIENATCTITVEDFNNHFKTPTKIAETDDIIYFFYMNSKKYPECYRENVLFKSERYSNCTVFSVHFDLNGKFKRISTGNFGY
jgi:hypothetical protein